MLLTPALRAYPDQLQPTTEDVISAAIVRSNLRKIKGKQGHVVHSAATDTPHVVVGGKIAVETRFRSPEIQLADNARLGEPLQIPIYGSQTDFWQAPTNNGVQHTSRWVGFQFPEFVQDHLPLPGMSLKRCLGHALTNYYW